ncbi:cupin domain-containing protein [Patescibacteria group bacterium]|nr:cupin domain-containing protein [Patescibacteria group bacterium]
MNLKDLQESQRLFKGDKIKSGFVVLRPGEEVGEHITENCEEFILIIEGEAEIYCNFPMSRETVRVKAMEWAQIGKDRAHNVKNIGDDILKYIYIVALH